MVSEISDRLVWKDLVECHFRKGTHKRPAIFERPRADLLELLSEAKENLQDFMDAFDRCQEGNESETENESENENDNDENIIRKKSNRLQQQLNKTYVTLSGAMMTVDLLNDSGVGKTVSVFLKKGKKIRPDRYEGTLHMRGQLWSSSLKKFTPLLEKWKDIAARDGVEMSESKNRSSLSSLSSGGVPGGSFNYTEEDYEEDVEVYQSCNS